MVHRVCVCGGRGCRWWLWSVGGVEWRGACVQVLVVVRSSSMRLSVVASSGVEFSGGGRVCR